MRTTWHRVSLVGLLAIAIAFCLSLWLAISGYGNTVFWHNISPMHHHRATLSNLTSVTSANEQSTEIVYGNRCLEHLQQQDYETALTNCKQAVEHDANNLEARLNFGLAHYHLENYPQAIAQYQLVILQNSRDYRAFYNLGLVNAAQKEYQQAIENYNTSLGFASAIADQDQALIFNDLGAVQILLKKYSEAIINLNQAVELDPKSISGYFNRGCAHHHQGSYLAGIEDFSQVIELAPNYTEAYVSRAILNHLIRHERAAYIDLEVALQQYQLQGDQASYQKILGLKESMIQSKVHQTA